MTVTVIFIFIEKHLTNQLQRCCSLTNSPSPPFCHTPLQCSVVYACVLTGLVFNKSEINVFDAKSAWGLSGLFPTKRTEN